MQPRELADHLAELQEVSDRAARLQRVTASLAGVLDREQVARIALDDAMTELRATRGVLLLVVPDGVRAGAALSPAGEFAFVLLPLAAGYALLTGPQAQLVSALAALSMLVGPVTAKAIEGALHALGFGSAGNVRQGKYIEVEVAEKDPARARAEVERMCKELLANTIVENYAYELEAA